MITRATVRLLLGSCISMWQYPLALRNKRPMRPEPVVTPTQLLGISHYSGWLWFIEIGWMQTSNHFEDLRVRLLQSSTSNGESAVSISMSRSTLLLWHECHLHCVARKLTCGHGASHCGFPWIWWIKNELIYEYVFFFIQALLLPRQPCSRGLGCNRASLILFFIKFMNFRGRNLEKKVSLPQEWRLMHFLKMPDIGVALLVIATNNLGGKLQQGGEEQTG